MAAAGRVRASGGELSRHIGGAAAWLTERFDPASPRVIDVEVLLLEGDVDAARDAAEKLPTATPHDRFAKAEREELVRYQASGEVDWTALREAAAAIPAGLDRVAADRASRAFKRARVSPATTGSSRCSRC